MTIAFFMFCATAKSAPGSLKRRKILKDSADKRSSVSGAFWGWSGFFEQAIIRLSFVEEPVAGAATR
jgi:hypothetical protein